MNEGITRSANGQGKVTDCSRKPSKGTRPKQTVTTDHGIVVGIDVSEKRLNMCEIDAEGTISEARLANSAKKLVEHFEGKTRRRVIIEVGAHTRWIAELLDALGHQVLVVDPRRTKLISGSLYKDDRVDAQTLAMLGRDAPNLLKTVPVRRLESQMVLTLVRARAGAVKGRTRIINAIRGLLKPYGYTIPKDGRGATFTAYVRQTLDPALLRIVENLLVLIDTFNAQIKRYDDDVALVLPRFAPETAPLTDINGVGALTVLYFVALIGDPHRFAKSRDVGAYLGLCRRRQDSGDYKSELGITKAGDSLMRALLANCASYILGPFGQDSDIRRWGLKKVGGGSRVEKKKAKIAVARKLAVLMTTLWKTGRTYIPLRNEHTKKAA
jgi:transposase